MATLHIEHEISDLETWLARARILEEVNTP
jgi:hypothetical protein